MRKRIVSPVLCLLLLFFPITICGAELPLSCRSAVLMEALTGQILFSENMDEALPPASVTKIMTLLIIMEELSAGNLQYDDMVTASERAKSMGGSTIYLDTGEVMSVYDLIRGIAVASANDACVAMAEHIAGSEEAFVARMNETAARLGMEHTHFVNTNGLDADGHVTSAYDIALMSRALLSYPDILKFTTIWTDSLRDGTFGLANTNRLIRFYDGANGLKTGSTDRAGCCISATALRDGMQLIAVVMASPTSDDRFSDARTLLDYGFSSYKLYRDETAEPVGTVPVNKGAHAGVAVKMAEPLTVLIARSNEGLIVTDYELSPSVTAPICAGTVLGKAICRSGDTVIGSCDLVAVNDVEKMSFFSALRHLISFFFR